MDKYINIHANLLIAISRQLSAVSRKQITY